MLDWLRAKMYFLQGQECTGSSIEVEEAACGKLNKLLAFAVEIERDLLNLHAKDFECKGHMQYRQTCIK